MISVQIGLLTANQGGRLSFVLFLNNGNKLVRPMGRYLVLSLRRII